MSIVKVMQLINIFILVLQQQDGLDHLDILDLSVRVIIVSHLENPLPLARCSHGWYDLVYSSDVKSTWLLSRYGRTHALFHAVRIGDSFITPEVVELMLKKGAQISQYFIQRLVLGFGKYDQKLINLKLMYHVRPPDLYQASSPWASNLSVDVFSQLLNEGYDRFGENNISARGNDMEKFYYHSGGPLEIGQVKVKIQENMDEINKLIRIYKFAPFPPRPTIRNSYHTCDVSDGYADVLQLNIIARPILICPEL